MRPGVLDMQVGEFDEGKRWDYLNKIAAYGI